MAKNGRSSISVRTARRVGLAGSVCCLVAGRHGLAQDGFGQAVRHAAERPDGDDPAGVVDNVGDGPAHREDGLAGEVGRHIRVWRVQ